MATRLASTTLGSLARTPLVDKRGMANWEFLKRLQEWDTKLNRAITLLGDIAAAAVVEGRTEGIGTTVGQLTATGQLASADQVAADGTSFVRVPPNNSTGGLRGFNALDANNRLANSFRVNPVNISEAPTAATNLSNDGAVTSITVAANTKQFGAGQVSYNSGSVDPGSYGTVLVYADDPTYAGGAVTYQFTTLPEILVAAEGRIIFGKITTTSGTSQTGGGNTGGTTPAGEGGKGYLLL